MSADAPIEENGGAIIRLKTTATEICIRDYRAMIEALKPFDDEEWIVGINSADTESTPYTCVTTHKLSKGHRIKLCHFVDEERLEDEKNTDDSFHIELFDCEGNTIHKEQFDSMKDAMQIFSSLYLFFA
jgi:hypothetical protein